MPRLTHYLLKLATDTKALDEYRRHGHEQERSDLRTFLTRRPEPGLTPEQADALASRDPKRITAAVQEELTLEASHDRLSIEGLGIIMYFEVHHIQGHPQD